MSGICAVWHKNRPVDLTGTVSAVTAGLALSSSERPRHETDHGVGLGVQVRFADAQQIFRDPRVLLACDAELLNHRELAASIGARDQDVGRAALLAALYERHGEAFVEKLRGGFSVVLWDFSERRLVAAIDGFGIKRLAWYEDEHVLAVASRATALRPATGDLDINPRAIANVLNFGADLAPETIFKRVHRLEAGTLLRASLRDTRTTRYWDLRYGLDESSSESQLSDELERVVGESVAAHCAAAADLNPGAFLSGGTDSSTVLGMMSRAMGAPVKAFSIGYREQPFNELHYAELAARSFGSEHHTYLVSARDCREMLPDVIRCFDEPFGNASAIATYFCGWLAAQHGVDTLLAGDGGDELFGGNERYATEKIFSAYHSVPEWLRSTVLEPVSAMPAGALTRRARGYIRRAKMPGVERMYSFSFLRAHAPADVFTADFVHALGDYGILDIPTRHYNSAAASDHLDHLLYVDMKITLADSDLPKVTCVSELAGIRARFPFLEREVAEFSGRIPPRLKVKGLQKRYLFKRAFRNLLPREIIRKKKHGFGIPVATWMKSDPQIRELARDTLLSSRATSRAYFRREFLEDLFQKHEASDATYYGDCLWAFLMVELWHTQYIDQPARVVA